MTNSEFIANQQHPNFEDVVGVISKLVEPHTVGSTDEYGGEIEFPGWDGNIRRLDLEPDVAAQAGLGQSVRVSVIGDYESGIAMIMRSRNLFEARRFGFYIQPTDNPEGFRGLEVWQAPAQKPQRGKVYWGIELLDRQQAHQSASAVSESLIKSLQQAVK